MAVRNVALERFLAASKDFLPPIAESVTNRVTSHGHRDGVRRYTAQELASIAQKHSQQVSKSSGGASSSDRPPSGAVRAGAGNRPWWVGKTLEILNEFGHEEVSTVMWASVRMRYKEQRTSRNNFHGQLIEHVTQMPETLPPKRISQFILACAHLGVNPQTAVPLANRVLYANGLYDLDGRGVANLVWSLAKMQLAIPTWSTALAKSYSRQQKVWQSVGTFSRGRTA